LAEKLGYFFYPNNLEVSQMFINFAPSTPSLKVIETESYNTEHQ